MKQLSQHNKTSAEGVERIKVHTNTHPAEHEMKSFLQELRLERLLHHHRGCCCHGDGGEAPPAAASTLLQIHRRSVTFTAGLCAVWSRDHCILTIPWAAMSAARVLLPEVPGVQSARRTSWPPTSVRSISIRTASACSALSYSTTPKPRTGLPSS